MLNLPTYQRDEFRFILDWPQQIDKETGRVVRQRINKDYYDRRAGVTWPTPHNIGYFCILGLLGSGEITPMGRRPVELLYEFKTVSRAKLFRQMALNCKATCCKWVCCDTSQEVVYREMVNYRAKSGVEDGIMIPWPIENETGYTEAMTAILDLIEHEFLRIKRPQFYDLIQERLGRDPLVAKATSYMEIERLNLEADDLHSIDHTQPEHRFPAINALNHVIVSWELYPWRRPSPIGQPGVSRREGYG